MTAANDDDHSGAGHLAAEREVGQPPSAESGASEESELVGWHPDLLPAPEPVRMREVIAGMTDEGVLVFYRERDFNPYMTLSTARALYAFALKHRPTARAMEQAERDATEKQATGRPRRSSTSTSRINWSDGAPRAST